MTSATERTAAVIAEAAARTPTRRRHGRNLPAGKLTPVERRFVAALVAGESDPTTAYAKATGTTGESARVGGWRALRRPEVAAALIDAAKQRMAIGAITGANELVRLIGGAKSEYVRADAAKYAVSAAGLGPRTDTRPAGGAPITINIDIGEPGSGTSRVQITGPTPQAPDEPR